MTAGHSYPRLDWVVIHKGPADRYWIRTYHTKKPPQPAGAVAWRIETREGGAWVEVERGVR